MIGEGGVAAEPGRAAPRHFGNAARAPVRIGEIVELQVQGRLEGRQRLDRSGGAGRIIDAEGVTGKNGIAPVPEKLPAIHRILDRIAPGDRRIAPIEFASRLLAFGEEAGTGDPPNAPGDDLAFDLNFERFAWFRDEAHAARPEAVLGNFIAVAEDIEPNFMPHEFGKIEGHDPSVVGHEQNVIGGAQLHEWNRPLRPFLDDLEAAGFESEDVAEGSQKEGDDARSPERPGNRGLHRMAGWSAIKLREEAMDQHIHGGVFDRFFRECGMAGINGQLDIGPDDGLGKHCGDRRDVLHPAQLPGFDPQSEISLQMRKQFVAQPKNEDFLQAREFQGGAHEEEQSHAMARHEPILLADTTSSSSARGSAALGVSKAASRTGHWPLRPKTERRKSTVEPAGGVGAGTSISSIHCGFSTAE